MKGSKDFTQEERIRIINEAKEVGNFSAVARKYEIHDSVIHFWIKRMNKTKKQPDLHSEIKRLERLLSDSHLENSILKDLLKKTYQVWNADDQSQLDTLKKEKLKKK